MSIKAWIVKWLSNIGETLFRFTKTTAAGIIKEYGDDILKIIMECATAPVSGQEKMAMAISKLALLVPGVAEYVARAAIEVVYSTWKEYQEGIDTDSDGVPDYRDLCKELGAPEGGCVTPDGCPDADCDGVADSEDKCPNDPACR